MRVLILLKRKQAQRRVYRVSTLTQVVQHRVLPLGLTWCYGMAFTPIEAGTP